MITLKQWMELVNYRITEGSEYMWHCYGHDAFSLSYWNGIHDDGGFSVNIVFDTTNQTVYEVDVCDYTNARAYRMINPEYKKAHNKEVDAHTWSNNHADEAWEHVRYVDLEVVEDFIEKCQAIVQGRTYDTRVVVPLELSDSDMLMLYRLAHEADISLNAFVEKMLVSVIKQHERQESDDVA
jgi:predicted HicB family RNase H-like nuclease